MSRMSLSACMRVLALAAILLVNLVDVRHAGAMCVHITQNGMQCQKCKDYNRCYFECDDGSHYDMPCYIFGWGPDPTCGTEVCITQIQNKTDCLNAAACERRNCGDCCPDATCENTLCWPDYWSRTQECEAIYR